MKIMKKNTKKTPIKITKKATKQILFLLNQEKKSKGIKIKIKKSGCAGFKYILKLAYNIYNSDDIFVIKNIKFIIPKDIISKLETTTIDFSKTGLNYSFTFKNKNHISTCGCGESFNI
ncbi:Protein SufA [Buchnera aphidicola (Cinara curvipes)]|uniref:Protein SufA n=2 Tax=Buchnera aphidicola TaxID=9 RepID=A0A451D6E7_9GAMM|nr:Protein SufA [Buchnera aphidicola (Cinara curvipes)]